MNQLRQLFIAIINYQRNINVIQVSFKKLYYAHLFKDYLNIMLFFKFIISKKRY